MTKQTLRETRTVGSSPCVLLLAHDIIYTFDSGLGACLSDLSTVPVI